MLTIFDQIEQWIKGILIGIITGNLSNLFGDLNTKVGDIANQVGQTPSGWNSGICTLVQNISQTVIVPIAGIILTFVMTYELIQMVIDKNNLHDLDTFLFFKWIFKTYVAVMLVTHTFDIVMAVFDMAQHVVQGSGAVIHGSTAINLTAATDELAETLKTYDISQLIILCMESQTITFSIQIMSLCITLITYGRMIEIYLYCSLGPIPLATMANREQGQMGQNYLRSLFALGFQGFLIMICVGIYAVLVQSIPSSTDVRASLWTCAGYTLLLCFSLFRTGSLARSIFNAH